jgi:thermitase
MSKISKILFLLVFVFGVVLVIGEGGAQVKGLKKEISPSAWGIKNIEPKIEYAPNEILVKFKIGVNRAQKEAFFQNLKTPEIKKIEKLNVHRLEIPSGKTVPEMIEKFRKNPLVEYVEPNYVAYKTAIPPNDPYFFSQWALFQESNHDIDAPESWEITTGSSSIIIAIIDDGIDYLHEEFGGENYLTAGKLWINPTTTKPGYDFGGSFKENNKYVPDDDVTHEPSGGHGTATAGIAAALTNNAKGIVGTDWEAIIMPLKVENGEGEIYHSYIAEAIIFAANQGADVLSMSLGGSGSSILSDACNYAWTTKGKILVASTGNTNSSIIFPAAYSTTIAVGATNENDQRCETDDWSGGQGSNYGPEIDVVAPGNNIYTPDWSGSNGYTSGDYFSEFGGTSASCPFVAGIAALILSHNSSLTNTEIRDLIRNTAEDELGDSLEDTPGFDNYYGYGRVNLYYSLLGAAPSPTPDLTLLSSDISFSNLNPTAGDIVTIYTTIHNQGGSYFNNFAGYEKDGDTNIILDQSEWIAQKFIPSANLNLSKVSLFIYDSGTDDKTTIEIRKDDGGKPGTGSNNLLVAKTLNSAFTSYAWQDFAFDNPPSLSGGVTYWICLSNNSLGTNGYIWMLNQQAGGELAVSFDQGASWTPGYSYYAYFRTFTNSTAVNFYDGDPDSGGILIDTDSFSPIPYFKTKTASVEWTAVSGTHDIYVKVDPDNLIPESDETNNKAYKSILLEEEIISISIENNAFDYGTLPLSASSAEPVKKSTIDLNKTPVIENTGNVDVDLAVKSDNATGGAPWNLETAINIGQDKFCHQYSTNSGADWIDFLTPADTWASDVITNMAPSATANLDLQT